MKNIAFSFTLRVSHPEKYDNLTPILTQSLCRVKRHSVVFGHKKGRSSQTSLSLLKHILRELRLPLIPMPFDKVIIKGETHPGCFRHQDITLFDSHGFVVER